MVGSGKIVGFILIGVGAILDGLALLWLLSSAASGALQGSGFMLGLAIAQVLTLPLFGFGAFLLVKSQREAAEFAAIEKQRAILNLVQTQGKVKIAEVALQLRLNRDQVKNYVYDLVGKGLFTGYVNWNEGVLISKSASEMRSPQCPNCGGEREVVGQGVVKCAYCGSELFVG